MCTHVPPPTGVDRPRIPGKARFTFSSRKFDKLMFRTVRVIDKDILEQLVRLKLYVMAGVGGCIVLLSSFIAATCIYTIRRKQDYLQVKISINCQAHGHCQIALVSPQDVK